MNVRLTVAAMVVAGLGAGLIAGRSGGSVPATAPVVPVEFTGDAQAPGKPLVHFWSVCVGAGRANEGLRASWQEQLRMVSQECGFQYVRFHGLFHDDMFVYHEDKDGKPYYNFQYVDELFDRMLAMNVRPFVELSFAPTPLATQSDTVFWWHANGSPPKDLNKWGDLVEHLARHLEQRYGADEVRKWYFEVWNEPNGSTFFKGGNAQKYFDLYAASAQAIKRVDAQLRVGGPATSAYGQVGPATVASTQPGGPSAPDTELAPFEPKWVPEFFDFCVKNKLPVDFVSAHPYPDRMVKVSDAAGNTASLRRSVNATRMDLENTRKLVDAGPFPKAEIHLTEWSSSSTSRDFIHDLLPEAAFIAKENAESFGLVDSLSYWTFTDVFEEKGAGDTIFHGGFGLVNYQGIVKPAFHAYRFLNLLGDEVVARYPGSLTQPVGAIVTRHKATGRLSALAYHYPITTSLASFPTLAGTRSTLAQGQARPWKLTLTHLPRGAKVRLETLDSSHGNAVAAWQAMGSPEPPTREQTAKLKEAALATKQEEVSADATGTLEISRLLDPWSVVLVQQE